MYSIIYEDEYGSHTKACHVVDLNDVLVTLVKNRMFIIHVGLMSNKISVTEEDILKTKDLMKIFNKNEGVQASDNTLADI